MDIYRYLSTFTIEEKAEGFFRASGRIAASCPLFRGHFPGKPILPGAFHVWIAFLALTQSTGTNHRLVRISKAKFRQPLLPGDAIAIFCHYNKEGNGAVTARVTIEKDGKVASKFTIVALMADFPTTSPHPQ